MPVSATSATEFLSVTEQTALIAAVQDVPVTLDEVDGVEVVRYGSTAASEDAFARLYAAFTPALEKASRASKVMDADDALAVAYAEFAEAVRDFDPSAPLPFSATIATRLRYAVLRADRANDVVVVKDNVAAVYWRLIHKHEGDFAAAYEEVRTTANGLAPSTFLAVHHVIGGIDSLDPMLRAEDGETGARHSLATSIGSHEERIATEAEAEWLLSLVTDEEETICRLAYGFRDLATEKIRVDAGFKGGEILTDVEISGTSVPLGRATIQRRRKSALDTMRAALEDRAFDA